VPYDAKPSDDFVDTLARSSAIPYGAPSRGGELRSSYPPSRSAGLVRHPNRSASTQTLGPGDEAAQRWRRPTGSTAFQRSDLASTSLFQTVPSRSHTSQVERTSRPSSYVAPLHVAYPSIIPALPSSSRAPVVHGPMAVPSPSTSCQYPSLRPREFARLEYVPEAATSARPPRPPKIPSLSVPPPRRTPTRDPSFGRARTEGGVLLRDIVLDTELISTFVAIASANTERNIETCALLLGRLSNKSVTTLLAQVNIGVSN
jgi:hypothetical protein